MVEPRANSATPSRRATSTLGANSVAMPSASKREAHDSAPARYRHVTMPTPGSASGAVTARRYPGSTTMSLSFTSSTECRARRASSASTPDLGIGRRASKRSRSRCAAPGNSRLQSLDILQRGVVGRVHAEEDFELGIVLRGMREDGFVEARVAPVNRLENGERRQGVRRGRPIAAGRQRAAAISTRQ